jgi:hypothetical protein
MAKQQENYQHFGGSVAKINRDGDEVLSDHLAPGERLKSDVDAEKAQARKTGAATNRDTTETADTAKKGDRERPTGEVKTVTNTNSGKTDK